MSANSFLHLASALAVSLIAVRLGAAAPPQAPVVPAEIPPQIEASQPGVKLTLLAEHPDLVTPIGIDVDAQSRIYVVSSHTHFRPQGYPGPGHDEILVFDRDGKRRHVFYDKTDKTMNVKAGPGGWIYLSERGRILRVKDTDGDGVGDVEENLATLSTAETYPHNGLNGMAWHPDGGLIFSVGENYGVDWTLTSKDGVKFTGRGEGGIFYCRPDGTGLRRMARGFWNPFGLLVRDDGEIFAVDNDPGSRPPCRLLSIIEGADYGFQHAYGNAPVHPFVAWNGELRGTLPMICPSGEAPCALVAVGGGVMVPSWSDHRIDYFPLVRKGAGYTSQRIELLHGGEFFRPVSIARGPDGAFYLTDWVFSSYELHGRGRLWKLEIDQPKATWIKKMADPLNDAARLAGEIRGGQAKFSEVQLFEQARGGDANLSDAALTALARASFAWTTESVRSLPGKDRVWALVALRRVNLKEEKWVRALLDDADPEVRFECLRWIADEVLTSFSAQVEQKLKRPDLDYREFEAVLATWNTLRGNPGAGVTDTKVLMERVMDSETPPQVKGFALRLVPATDPKITLLLLRNLLAVNDPTLSLEVVRTLVSRNADDARAVLAEIAPDDTRDAELRAEAVAGLSASAEPGNHALLVKLASHDNTSIRHEALRALRFSGLDDAARSSLTEVARHHPESASLVKAVLDVASINAGRPALDATSAWLKRLDALPGKADAQAGRRIFFHPGMAMCATCHRHSGRGNVVGPDLSLIAQQGDRQAILQSILEPDREIAPQFLGTQLELKDGTTFTGIMLAEAGFDLYRDLTGKDRFFKKGEIVKRTELKTSLMPTGLPMTMTDEELRDLLEFLMHGAPEPAENTPLYIPLWPGKAPLGDGNEETVISPLRVYLPPADKATGAAVVICPGGGYIRLVMDREGYPSVDWLNAHGIAAILLSYRLPEGRPYVPLLDAQRAIRTVRANAPAWKIDPHRVGILGFSAGGHVASTAGTHFDAGHAAAADPVERLSCRPDFMLLVYPVVTMMGEAAHGLSKAKLLGADPQPELVRLFSNETQVSGQTPPAFLAHARDDTGVPPENSRNFVAAMKAHGVPVEYLELPSGGHGLGNCHGPLWEEWKAQSLKWLAAQKVIPPGAP